MKAVALLELLERGIIAVKGGRPVIGRRIAVLPMCVTKRSVVTNPPCAIVHGVESPAKASYIVDLVGLASGPVLVGIYGTHIEPVVEYLVKRGVPVYDSYCYSGRCLYIAKSERKLFPPPRGVMIAYPVIGFESAYAVLRKYDQYEPPDCNHDHGPRGAEAEQRGYQGQHY